MKKKLISVGLLMLSIPDWLNQPSSTEHIDTFEVVKIEEHHKKVIRDTWSLISSQLLESGTDVFVRIFQLSPSIKTVFAESYGYSASELQDASDLVKSEYLQLHVTKFMQAVQCSVENLNDLDTVVAPIFTNLGRHHTHLPSLHQEYFSVFSGALMFAWRTNIGEEKFTREVRTAWSRLFDYMLQHLAFGYRMGPL